jgi:hypothetical protein
VEAKEETSMGQATSKNIVRHDYRCEYLGSYTIITTVIVSNFELHLANLKSSFAVLDIIP